MSSIQDSNATNANDQSIIEVGVALPSGTNIIGQVGIDQTTPGTTNNISETSKYVSVPTVLSNNSYSNVLIDKFGRRVIRTSCQYSADEGRAFYASTNNINIGTTETAFFLFKNPSGSTIDAKIKKVSFAINDPSTISILRFYKGPTITSNGTSISIVNAKFSGSAGTSTCFSQPTISANGTLFKVAYYSYYGANQIIDIPCHIVVTPNTNFLLTVQNGKNSTPTFVSIEWEEE